MAALAGDVGYQQKLRKDFIKRRVHPTTEALVWAYAIGRPKDQIEVSAKVSMDERLAVERALFAELSVEDLAQLAEQSEALIATAREMAQRHRALTAAATLPGTPIGNRGTTPGEPAEESGAGHDV